MATVSNSSSLQAHNSPRQSRKSLRVSSSSNIPPPSIPMSGMVDQEQFLTSSSSIMASDSLPVKEANTVVAASSSSAEDGLVAPAGEDVQLDSSDNGGATKKPAWNKPSNGVTAEVGTVMGAESWPALSESARASPKSPSTYSLKASPYGSVTISQELAVGSLCSPKEVSTSITTPNSTSNHVVPSRQRSMKRGGGGGGGSSGHNTSPFHDSLSHVPPMIDVAPSNPGKSGGERPRDNINKDGSQRTGSYGGNETQLQRGFRRSNSGPLTRGDGSYHVGRRDHERGKQDWGNRSFGSRESQKRVGSRPFLRGPAPNAPFIPPPLPVAVQPFVAPVVYTEMPSPLFYVPGPHSDSLRPMPMVPIQSMFFPMPDPHLPTKIMNQIEYYFSNENLVKDTFLRQNMDGEGWVSIKLIAGFKKVMQLTDNIQLILDAVKASHVVEVQGDKVRRKSDWIKWIMPAVQTLVTSPQSINRSSQNMLAAHLNSVSLDEKATT